MTQTTESPEQQGRGPMHRAMTTIASLRAELESSRRRHRVAIVGLALRADGDIGGLTDLWEVLHQGRDVTRMLPTERLAGMERLDLLQSTSTRGGWLDNPFGFDAQFFSISPREARAMDPQHRLLLEVVWEAFEHAALPPSRHAATTGVYVGTTGQDHRWRADGPMSSTWTQGNGHSFAAGRVAYTLGFGGPSLAVDTACSSSLTALHLACRALADQECDIAVAAGVNLILTGQSSAELARTGALSPTGRCRPFDAHADGFVRGEGCVAVVLRRLDDAQRDGDRILSVIEASAINQDGRSAGFTAPNPAAQVDLLRSALKLAGLKAHDVGYVQAHGTGTPLGDPIELGSIAEFLGTGDRRGPAVTSAKANVGHLEAASGLLGVASAVAAQRAKWIPQQSNLSAVTSRAPESVIVPMEGRPWPKDSGQYAVVQSFGMSGTNACVVLGSASTTDSKEGGRDSESAELEQGADDTRPPGLLLSGHDRPAVARQAQALLTAVRRAEAPPDWVAIAETLWFGRTRLSSSVLVDTDATADIEEALRAVAEDTEHRAVHDVSGQVPAAEGSPRRNVDLPPYQWAHVDYVTEPRR